MKAKSVYSEETKKKARLLYKEGKSVKEITEALNVPNGTVYSWVNNYYEPKSKTHHSPREAIAVSMPEKMEQLYERIRELEYKHRLIIQILKNN